MSDHDAITLGLAAVVALIYGLLVLALGPCPKCGGHLWGMWGAVAKCVWCGKEKPLT